MEKKLKILYVSQAVRDSGGAEISLKTLANQFKNDGHEIVYCAIGDYPEFKTYIFKKFHPIYSFELYEKYLSKFIENVIEKENPDIIHANDRFTIIPSVIAAKSKNKPVAIHFRDFSLMTTTGLPYTQKAGYIDSFGVKQIFKSCATQRIPWELYKYAYVKRRYNIINKADAKICISHAIKQWVDKQGIKDSLVVNNPISPEIPENAIPKDEIRKEWNIPNEANVVLFIGGFSIGKGIDMIYKIVDKYNARNKNVYFLFVGRGGEVEKIKDLANKYKNIIHINKLPHNEIYKAYKASDMVLLPSKMEPFSRIVIETMFMDRPIISSSTGGGKEVVINMKTGILADPENVNEWMNAIDTIIDNKNLSNKFKSHYKNITNKYSKEETYKDFLSLYYSILPQQTN